MDAVPGSGYTVGWGTLALINAALAQGRGRPAALWFLISLVLGPIATLLIVVLPPQVAPTAGAVGPGWRPRPFTRLDSAVLAFIVGFVILAIVIVALPSTMSPRP
jgi:hypothetical protein